ncbi:MAG: septum formation protein Maf [Chloroflexi bacterium]|nr:septum formation protein Maf [Chloroflexota bacterium]
MPDPQAPFTFVLASASPRRRELLALTGWPAIVRPASADEQPLPGEGAVGLAQRLSQAKAVEVAARADGRTLVLGADTVVSHEEALLGKPADEAEARRMLDLLRGQTHEVITALTLVADDGAWQAQEVCHTPVPMRDYTPQAVGEYLASGAAFDKAGAYGIQDRPFDPVDVHQMTGCYANVMGLPLCHLVRLMRRRDLRPAANVPAACQAHTGYRCGIYAEILGTGS